MPMKARSNGCGGNRRVRLAYGRKGLDVHVPAEADIIEPRHLPGLADEVEAVRQALRQPGAGAPLRDLVPRGATVGISICDITRPFPARRVLPVLFEELDYLDPSAITLFVATGTHRLCTDTELLHIFGPQIVGRYRVEQHDAFDPARHCDLGTVRGTNVPVRLERGFLEQDVRITTGFIEPHFFAGFSGGPKMVAPGLAQLETVLELHSAARIGDRGATWGITHGNPVHDAVRAIAARAGVTFNLDVTLNREHAITNVFTGELFASHAAGCVFARATAMARVQEAYDVVLTSNSGYPLDQNLYQSVKGMSAAAQIVKPGGSIVIASECADGLPAHGGYRLLLRQADGPDLFLTHLAESDLATHDQWQVQVQALVQRKARVFVKADGLSPDEIRSAWLEPTDDVASCVEAALRSAGPNARVAVLPQGPQTIPYVACN
jgi:nickel-dependent lactate racemase